MGWVREAGELQGSATADEFSVGEGERVEVAAVPGGETMAVVVCLCQWGYREKERFGLGP